MFSLRKNWMFALFIIIVACSFFLRFSFIDYFRYEDEMARDEIIAERILDGSIYTGGLISKIGHEENQQSFGPLYYYLIAFALFFLPSSSYYYPLAPYLMVTLFFLFSVILFYAMVSRFFSRDMAWGSTLLYVTGIWPFLHFSVVLTNPNFLPFFVVAFMYFIFSFVLESKPYHLAYAMVTLALALQFHLSSLMLAPFILVALFLKRKDMSAVYKPIMWGIGGMVLVFLPFIMYTLQQGSMSNVLNFIVGRKTYSYMQSFIDASGISVMLATSYLGRYLVGDMEMLPAWFDTLNLIFIAALSFLVVAGFFFALSVYIKKKENPYLLVGLWLFLPTFLFAISGKNVSPHYLIVTLPAQYLLITLFLKKLKRAHFLSVIFIIVALNFVFLAFFFHALSVHEGTRGIYGVPYSYKQEVVSYIAENTSPDDAVYLHSKKKEFHYLFQLRGLPEPKRLENVEDFSKGYLILDTFSFYTLDDEVPAYILDALQESHVVSIGPFDVFKR